MIKGEYIREIRHDQQQQIILNYLNDYVEVLSNFTLISTYFPESVFEIIRGTNVMIFLANSYCVTLHLKKDITNIMGIRLPNIRKHDKKTFDAGYLYASEIKTVKQLCAQSCLKILDRVLLNNIGVHSKSFAVVQSQIAQTLK